MGGTNINPTPPEFKTRDRLILLGAAPAVAAGSRSWPSTSGASVAMEDSPVYLSTRPLRERGDAEEPAESPDADLRDIGRLLEAAATRHSWTLDSSETADSEFSREGLAYVAGYLACKLRSVDSSLGAVSSQWPPGGVGSECEWLFELSRGGLYSVHALRGVAGTGGKTSMWCSALCTRRTSTAAQAHQADPYGLGAEVPEGRRSGGEVVCGYANSHPS